MNNDEFTGRYHDGWVSKRFVLSLRNIKKETPLIIQGRRLPYPEILNISIFVNGNLIHQEVNPGEHFSITTAISPLARGTLEILASHSFVPKEKGMNDDVRTLSFLLDEIVMKGLPDLMETYNHIFDFKPSKMVYFIDDEIWDSIVFLVNDHYKIPDKGYLIPFKDTTWWKKISYFESPSLAGRVYDKFSGRNLTKAKVQVSDNQKILVTETTTNDFGEYEIHNLSPGNYMVTGISKGYGIQTIGVAMGCNGLIINLPMLPLNG